MLIDYGLTLNKEFRLVASSYRNHSQLASLRSILLLLDALGDCPAHEIGIGNSHGSHNRNEDPSDQIADHLGDPHGDRGHLLQNITSFHRQFYNLPRLLVGQVLWAV